MPNLAARHPRASRSRKSGSFRRRPASTTCATPSRPDCWCSWPFRPPSSDRLREPREPAARARPRPPRRVRRAHRSRRAARPAARGIADGERGAVGGGRTRGRRRRLCGGAGDDRDGYLPGAAHSLPIDASPSFPVLGFATAVSLATGLAVGIVPALIGSRRIRLMRCAAPDTRRATAARACGKRWCHCRSRCRSRWSRARACWPRASTTCSARTSGSARKAATRSS